MSPPIHTKREPEPEPTNSDLRSLIIEKHGETNRRLTDLEFHLIDPKHPEKTLPARVKSLESWQKAMKWVGGTVLGGALAGAGAWLWDSFRRGASPH